MAANGRYGIYTVGAYPSVRGSTVTQNGLDGILCGLYCLVADSNVSDNGRFGISIGSGTVLGTVIIGNASPGIAGSAATGYGNNTLAGNNGGGGAQVTGGIVPLQPNACTPVCP